MYLPVCTVDDALPAFLGVWKRERREREGEREREEEGREREVISINSSI